MNRESPEAILRRIKQQENSLSQGHLKIFFGYAAGVGKTYAMLKAAHSAREQGVDVVCGYIEPHARPQTAQLLAGLEQIGPLLVEHKGILLNEFDLDSALARKPQLILVDELAHTNSPQCRHIKRYKDIEEILKAGINVYTTINVQHIESLCDIVASITGIIVQERIPDHIFDKADQVELVDIEPADLIKRLNNGEIYKKNRVEKALNNFFSLDNLVALREIALRRAADRVNKLSDKVKPAFGCHADEHILVCLSSSPSNTKIIRTASRLAAAFKGNFTALFVESSNFQTMSEDDKKRLQFNTQLAEQLGAKIETAFGDDIAFQISEFAKYARVSKIVLGRSNTQRKFGQLHQTFAEQLTALTPDIDIYIIPDQKTPVYKKNKTVPNSQLFDWSKIRQSLSIIAITTAISLFFYALGFSGVNLVPLYILGVLITSIITVNLTVRIKSQAKQAAQLAYRTKILLETNQMLQQAKSTDDIAAFTANQLQKMLDKTIIFYQAEGDKLLSPAIFSNLPQKETEEYISINEQAVAQWVLKNNKHAGATTNTLNNAKCLYLAVRSGSEVYGVMGIALKKDYLDTFENSLLLSILGECALAMEKEVYNRKREEATAQAKNEKLRANLLRSISHDLRTPLTSISGNAGILISDSEILTAAKKQELYKDIYEDSMWLINLVENLLSVTRIEDGTMKISLQTESIDEIISEALQHVSRKNIEHNIRFIQPEEIFLAKMDARLIVQVIINIIDNALRYTPAHTEIVIQAKKENEFIKISIADNGIGIPDLGKEKIFEMFFSGNNKIADNRRGLGLGLALCKSIISAHEGDIWVEDNQPHGAVFIFTLHSEEVKIYE